MSATGGARGEASEKTMEVEGVVMWEKFESAMSGGRREKISVGVVYVAICPT